MGMNVPCPFCGKVWLLRGEAAGKDFDCPQCHALLALDADGHASIRVAPGERPDAAASPSASAPSDAEAPPSGANASDGDVPLDEVELVRPPKAEASAVLPSARPIALATPSAEPVASDSRDEVNAASSEVSAVAPSKSPAPPPPEPPPAVDDEFRLMD